MASKAVVTGVGARLLPMQRRQMRYEDGEAIPE